MGVMVNSIYDTARQRFALALIDWSTAPLVLLAYSGEPVFHAEDATITDITDRGETLLISTSQDIVTQNVSAQGYLQTDNVVFEAVPIGYPITHFIMTLSAVTPLLFIDEAYDLPFVPNGLDVVVTPDWLEQRGWGRL
jgi:hypothetical protein